MLSTSTTNLPLSHAEEKLICIGGMRKHHTCPGATLNGSAPRFSQLSRIGAYTSDVIPPEWRSCPSFLDCGPTHFIFVDICPPRTFHTPLQKKPHPTILPPQLIPVTTTLQNHSPTSHQNKSNRQNVCKYRSRQEHQLRHEREGGQGFLLFLVSCIPSRLEMSVTNSHLQWQDQ